LNAEDGEMKNAEYRESPHDSRRVLCDLCVPVPKILTTDYTDKHGWLSEASSAIRTNPSHLWSVSPIKPEVADGLLEARKSRAVTLIRPEGRL
jgi:hypothetical protein